MFISSYFWTTLIYIYTYWLLRIWVAVKDFNHFRCCYCYWYWKAWMSYYSLEDIFRILICYYSWVKNSWDNLKKIEWYLPWLCPYPVFNIVARKQKYSLSSFLTKSNNLTIECIVLFSEIRTVDRMSLLYLLHVIKVIMMLIFNNPKITQMLSSTVQILVM